MKILLAAVLCLAVATQLAQAENWALIIAGSNGYYNYRHQSDACHAWQIVTQKGKIPESNVVLMIYDDIANSSQNPVKGELINKPNGPNVYAGVVKDYTGSAVNAQNFLNVLQGNAAAMKGIGSGKVIASGPEDNVYVYYSDHGAPGLVAMPSGPYLYANDLIAALKNMSNAKKFKQLVFYLEACESGSMFDGLLPNNTNIYATTAANPDESSYAFYYDSKRGTYLGDEYSINWMEDSDVADFSTRTLEQQFNYVKNATAQSHVMLYGDSSWQSEPIGMFQGAGYSTQQSVQRDNSIEEAYRTKSYTSSRDVTLDILSRRVSAAQTEEERMEYTALLHQEADHRLTMDNLFDNLVAKVAPGREHLLAHKHKPRNFDCLKGSIESFEAKCGRLSDYALKHVQKLVNLCEENFSVEQIAEAVSTLC